MDVPARIGPSAIDGLLGRGGMGAVYRGRDAAGEPVAVKVLLAGRDADDAHRRRFEREVRALSRLRHPAIVDDVMGRSQFAGGIQGFREGPVRPADDIVESMTVTEPSPIVRIPAR